MKRVMRHFPSSKIIIFLLSFALLSPSTMGAPKNLDSDVEAHLQEYASVSTTHHDNIDDLEEEHSHKHKHSEDGEEHEHEHKHSDATQSQVQGMFVTHTTFSAVCEIASMASFFEKNLFSNPFLDGIFRPPIS